MAHRDNPDGSFHFLFRGRLCWGPGSQEPKDSKITQHYSFFAWHLSYSAVSLYVKDGFPSHRPKSRASKEIRMISIDYNDVVTSTSHFLHRYLLLTFLVQSKRNYFYIGQTLKGRSLLLQYYLLSSSSLRAIIIFLSLWNKANSYHNYLLIPHWQLKQ